MMVFNVIPVIREIVISEDNAQS